MSIIELTDNQRQALQVERGRPIELVDPETQQRYVLLAREQYERVRDVLEECPVNGSSTPISSANAVQSDHAERVRLRELPTPAEVIEEGKRWCKKYGYWGKKSRRDVEERMKLQYYFGGKAVYVVHSAEGAIVIPITDRFKNKAGLRYILLTPAERSHACLETPSPWHETVSEILM
jgi:hypothetical protein